MDLWLLLVAVVILLSFGVVFVGAPFVPTKRKDILSALELAELEQGDLVVDLGSGDGRVLQAAAAQGYRGLGYELSPIFALLSRVRLWKYRETTKVQMRNFWHQELPRDTAVVFVFLAGPFMNKLSSYLQNQADLQKRNIALISYGFDLPGHSPDKSNGPLKRYRIYPTGKTKA